MNMFRSPSATMLFWYVALREKPAVARRHMTDRFGRRAVTSLEYGIIASLIALMILSSLRQVGSNLSGTFTKLATTL